jgi:2-hydroxychromene-2-carboxylate isomerase
MPAIVTAWFDFASPFAYLGCSRIAEICARRGAEVVWHPLLLGALFRDIGTPDVPLMAAPEAKRRHAVLDLARYAHHWDVLFRWPSRFPMRTIRPLRLVLAAQRDVPERAAPLIERVFRAYWAEDRDIADAGVLAELAGEVGLDGAALVEATDDPTVKQILFERTREALEAGVFGVPTFTVGDELLWGQDRLELVEWLLESPGGGSGMAPPDECGAG